LVQSQGHLCGVCGGPGGSGVGFSLGTLVLPLQSSIIIFYSSSSGTGITGTSKAAVPREYHSTFIVVVVVNVIW
jgi:hypothetical protein